MPSGPSLIFERMDLKVQRQRGGYGIARTVKNIRNFSDNLTTCEGETDVPHENFHFAT